MGKQLQIFTQCTVVAEPLIKLCSLASLSCSVTDCWKKFLKDQFIYFFTGVQNTNKMWRRLWAQVRATRGHLAGCCLPVGGTSFIANREPSSPGPSPDLILPPLCFCSLGMTENPDICLFTVSREWLLGVMLCSCWSSKYRSSNTEMPKALVFPDSSITRNHTCLLRHLLKNCFLQHFFLAKVL